MTFFNAIAQGDADTAKAASIGSKEDKLWIDAMVALITGLRDYDDALLQRFGPEANSADVDLKAAIHNLAEDPLTGIDGGIVKEATESAEIDPAYKGIRLARRSPLFLRRDRGVWKMDLETLRDQPQHNPALASQYLSAGKALHQAAQEIRRGRYKTFAAAQRASSD